MARRDLFDHLKSEGALLPVDLLSRVFAEDKSLAGLRPADYHLAPRETLSEAVTRSWNRLQGVWAHFSAALENLAPDDPGTGLTRQNWSLVLFQELGYGHLESAKGLAIGERSVAISHLYQRVPIHLVGANLSLDRRSPGVVGAATASPHSLVQEFLNSTERYRWAMVSNGRLLRVLRDNQSLTRQAYLEFDLASIMAGEAYADFKLLWLVCHQSRVAGERPAECWLERWSGEARQAGTRALEQLRSGVETAIAALGTGFLEHPDNVALRQALSEGRLDRQDYYRQLLRLVYRLLFLFVAEDRGLLHGEVAPEVRRRFAEGYSTIRLRRLAETVRGSRHADLYDALRVVMQALGGDGCAGLGIPALGSFLWSAGALGELGAARLSNARLLEAVGHLSVVQDGRVRRRVDYRNLGSEELGSVYESLLEQHPRLELGAARFELATAAGHERKTTGSYYTPPELVKCLLDSALDPVAAARRQALRGRPLEEVAQGLLELKVVDPACGSGHFLIAAAHRLARAVASARTGEEEPSPQAYRTALRQVISRCLYGVDCNEMAVELCKVSLWLESLEPGRPLSFLDAHIRVGNSLLGTTAKLVGGGLPDEAFSPLEGDDKKLVSALKKRNKQERESGQRVMRGLFDGEGVTPPRVSLPTVLEGAEDSLAAVRDKEHAFRRWLQDGATRHAYRVYDAWCAAFVQECSDPRREHLTHAVLVQLQSDRGALGPELAARVEALARDYRFFHWELAFPQVFTDRGGFDVVLGNPPWERVKLQEKEWFAERVPEIAAAGTAAHRARMIAKLETEHPEIWAAFKSDQRRAEGESGFLRRSGRFPLCGRGDVNTYSVFAETMRALMGRQGRVGCIVPSGIATDDTTRLFFAELVNSKQLASLLSFENEDKIFPAVHHSFKFCLLSASGTPEPESDFIFYVRRFADLDDPDRHFSLSPEDFARLNPNTLTCPIFRGRRDADLNLAIYRRVPVLWQETPESNPWGLNFLCMLHMSGDSGHFRTAEELRQLGATPHGTRRRTGDGGEWVPLYEAKMLHHYQSRFGTYEGQTEAQARMSKLPESTLEQLQDPEFQVMPRYWVPRSEVEARLQGRWDRGWLLGWRDITNTTNQRTVIAGLLPRVGVGHTTPLFLTSVTTVHFSCFYANLCSFVFDYLARQKVGGTHLTYSYLKQLPVLPPKTYDEACPWHSGATLVDWIVPRVVELSYTGYDLEAFGLDCGYPGPPFRFDPERRFELRCQLDAAYFHLYGLAEEDVAYAMDTFPIVRREEEKDHGSYRSRDRILNIYREMAAGALVSPIQPADPAVRHPQPVRTR